MAASVIHTLLGEEETEAWWVIVALLLTSGFLGRSEGLGVPLRPVLQCSRLD